MRSPARRRNNTGPLLLLAVMLVLLAVIVIALGLLKEMAPEPDPHEGQVYINDGFGMVWMTPLEGVDVNPIQRGDIRVVNGKPEYVGAAFETSYGVDVSEHQYEIDWQQVADSGVDFAMVRIGRRGYTEGGVFDDPWFKTNMEGASAAGLQLGVYFFSQAVSVEEAIEEADFVIDRLKGYNIQLPVVFDWEKIEGGGARTDDMDEAVLTECARAFCQRIAEAGYEPCVYFNRHLGYYGFDLSLIDDYKFWIALPGTFPDFYYAAELWQYSFTSQVPGIEGDTDMNMLFTPVTTPTPLPSESPAA